jgi:hypothetical protein
MRLKIRCDGWKRKYFGYAWQVNVAYVCYPVEAIIHSTAGMQRFFSFEQWAWFRYINSPPKFHYVKRRFSITSKYRHVYGVLNVDEIKN